MGCKRQGRIRVCDSPNIDRIAFQQMLQDSCVQKIFPIDHDLQRPQSERLVGFKSQSFLNGLYVDWQIIYPHTLEIELPDQNRFRCGQRQRNSNANPIGGDRVKGDCAALELKF